MKVACIKKKHLKHSQKFCVKYRNEFLFYLIGPPSVEPCFRTGAHVTNFTIDGFFAFALVFCNRFVVNGNAHYFPSPLSTFTRNWALQCNVSLDYHRELVGLMKWKNTKLSSTWINKAGLIRRVQCPRLLMKVWKTCWNFHIISNYGIIKLHYKSGTFSLNLCAPFTCIIW